MSPDQLKEMVVSQATVLHEAALATSELYAKVCWGIYSELKKAGFSHEDAMELTKLSIKGK